MKVKGKTLESFRPKILLLQKMKIRHLGKVKNYKRKGNRHKKPGKRRRKQEENFQRKKNTPCNVCMMKKPDVEDMW